MFNFAAMPLLEYKERWTKKQEQFNENETLLCIITCQVIQLILQDSHWFLDVETNGAVRDSVMGYAMSFSQMVHKWLFHFFPLIFDPLCKNEQTK